MTFADRVEKIKGFGFTERQATFLVTVMLHGGVCIQRQYCTSARLAHGQKTRRFFHDLVKNRYASAYPCAQRTAHVYHVHAKSLYETIAEPNNRNRRVMSLARAIEGLMVLDAVIGERQVTWLATEQDKVGHFTTTTRIRREELPQLTFTGPASETVRYFPDKLPIGVLPDGRTHLFVYVVNKHLPVDFRVFLYRHAPLLRTLPRWTIRLLVPPHLHDAAASFQSACEEELGIRLAPGTIEELRWYFHQRRKTAVDPAAVGDVNRYRRARRVFGAPRYRVLYRHWLTAGEPLIHALVSPVLPDAVARGAGRIETHVLTRRYQHLSPLVGTA